MMGDHTSAQVAMEARLRVEIARAIQEACPAHETRDYTPVDAAYDRAAEVARGGKSWEELHAVAAGSVQEGSGPDLDAVRARANAASPGPWVHVVEQDGDEDGWNGQDAPTCSWFIPAEVDADGDPFLYEAGSSTDAEFIAHARHDVPALLSELEQRAATASDLVKVLWDSVGAVEGLAGELRGHDRERALSVVSDLRIALDSVGVTSGVQYPCVEFCGHAMALGAPESSGLPNNCRNCDHYNGPRPRVGEIATVVCTCEARVGDEHSLQCPAGGGVCLVCGLPGRCSHDVSGDVTGGGRS